MGKFDKPKPNLNARRFGGPQPGQGKGHSKGGGNSHHRASGGVSHSHGNTKERVREHSPSAKLGVEKFDYLLVVDFEATCEADRPNYPNEIIEFPCVVIDTKKLEVIHKWRSYVKPKRNPILTPFCTELTGIQQSDVDNAKPLREVLEEFEAWFLETIPENSSCIFATDGPWDLRNFFYEKSVIRDNVKASSFFHAWVDIRTTFYKWKRLQKPMKLNKMLLTMGLKFQGREHCGLDDATNIALLAVEMLKQGCKFEFVVTVPHAPQTYTFPPWVDEEKLRRVRQLAAMQEEFGGEYGGQSGGLLSRAFGRQAPAWRRMLPLVFMAIMTSVSMFLALQESNATENADK